MEITRGQSAASVVVALAMGLFVFSLGAATLTLSTNALGPTPALIAYNSGHFFTNSNTKDWWRYAGVSGARVFLSPSEIEPSDDLGQVGDGVTDAASFLARKAALRADPLNPAYINWGGSSVFSNRYESNDLYPNNHIVPNYTFREMRRLGVQICAQLTASQSRWPLAGTNDWPNMWELWQHFYAQAFYLGRVFDVERYQVFNEPNHPNANGLTITNHLLRLQIASDAVQSALADVNARYGKTLAAKMLAPVTSGSADGSYAGWGESLVTNRHVNFLGQTDTNFSLLQVYDYHQYGSTPSTFGSDLANLHSFLTADMSPEPRFPTAISEFNTDTGANFDTQTETLDTPAKYSRFGAVVVNLLANGISELYAFKFSQTERDPPTTYPVAKNAMHYVDNLNSPYHVGGITKAGEVYRLFNKAFAPGRTRLGSTKGSGATSFDVHASYDPVRKRYHLFSVNNTTTAATIDLAFTTLPVPVGQRVLLEEVSETLSGGVRLWTNVPAGRVIAAGSQSSNSVWLLTLPTEPQAAEQIILASDDAEVRDGTNKNNNYGSATSMTARNDPANTANRSAAFMKFNLGNIALTNIEFAILSFQASIASVTDTAQAHVYALATTNWSQGAITWATAPNLKQNVTAGNTIAKQCVTGAGDTAFIVGQVIVNSTTASERLIDVTDWLRGFTNTTVSFVVSQDPRWDVELPSLTTGDTQPDGMKILTGEGGNAPRLRLVLRSTGSPTNMPPVAQNDSATTPQNTPVVVNVLTNDSDLDGGTLAIVSFTQGASGNVSNNGNGTLTYSPNLNFTGADSFNYTITDGQGGTNVATVNLTVTAVGGTPYWTNLLVATEAFVRGGANAALDQDEVATGYIMVKYNATPFDTARKAYFQFDLGGLNVDPSTQGVFSVVTHTNTFQHRAQLWTLSQAYPGFTPAITWNTAQANDTAANSLLTSGPFTATPVGASFLFPATASAPYSFALTNLGNALSGDRITLVLTGVDDAANNAGGLRLARDSATLQVRVIPALPPPPAATNPPVITSIVMNSNGSVTMNFSGATNRNHWLQANTNLVEGTWINIATNSSATDGAWSVTDYGATNQAQRFYRAVLP